MRYGLLRFLCGNLILAMAFLLSTLLRGEYPAPTACWIALLVLAQVSAWTPLRSYILNPLSTMDGHRAWGRNVNSVLPWTGLSITILITLVLFAVATRITQRQNL